MRRHVCFMNAQCTHSPHTHTITDTTSRGFRQCAFSLLFASVKKPVHASFTSANSAATSKATTPTDPAAMFISFWVFSANLFFVLEREKRQSGP